MALDFTKGILVLFMVLYHSVNYFRHDPDFIRFLQFLPPSFIFIAGFLVTASYLVRYDVNDTRMHARLFARGFKLFLVFVVLNLAVNLLLAGNYNHGAAGLSQLTGNLESVFITGNGRFAVFDVLLPIGYLLMLSAVLVKGCRLIPFLIPGFGCAMVGTYAVLELTGNPISNLELLSFGFLGMVLGFIPFARINRVAGHLIGIMAANAVYLLSISRSYPPYPLKLVGVCLALLLFYGIGLRLSGQGVVQDRIRLLGNYSLLAYIVQIGLLQMLRKALRGFDSWETQLAVALVATLVLMTFLIQGVDLLRRKSSLSDRLYKAVFA